MFGYGYGEDNISLPYHLRVLRAISIVSPIKKKKLYYYMEISMNNINALLETQMIITSHYG